MEERLGFVQTAQNRLGHAIVQERYQRGVALDPARIDRIGDAALDPHNLVEPALVCDVGSLGRPRRDRTQARHHQPQRARGLRRTRRVGVEHIHQPSALVRVQRILQLDEIPVLSRQSSQPGQDLTGSARKALQAGSKQRRSATQLEDRGHVLEHSGRGDRRRQSGFAGKRRIITEPPEAPPPHKAQRALARAL